MPPSASEVSPFQGELLGGIAAPGLDLVSLRSARSAPGYTMTPFQGELWLRPAAALGAYGEKFTKVCRLCGCDVESSEEILHLSLDSVVVRVQGMWILGFAPGLASATSGEQGLDDLVSQNHQTRQRT